MHINLLCIFQLFLPILQEAIFTEFSAHWSTSMSKKIPTEISVIWNRILKQGERSLDEYSNYSSSELINAEGQTKLVRFFEKTTLLVKLVGTLAGRLRQERRERYLFFQLAHLHKWCVAVFIALSSHGPR